MAKTTQLSGVSTSARLILTVLIMVLLILQWRLWISDEGWPEVLRLRSAVSTQISDNEQRAERNARLQAEVADLKGGVGALEERARADLGMVGEDESFYLFVPAED
ncbi:MAG: cell division protein FtsB [Gammaproteobacteria bacterium]